MLTIDQTVLSATRTFNLQRHRTLTGTHFPHRSGYKCAGSGVNSAEVVKQRLS